MFDKVPLVSARTITYNHAPYISQCIEGVLMQKTNFLFEYIIAEDCSTDGTREIVFEYARKYPDIIKVVTSDKNVGGKANAKRAFEACSGKYIAICEGDDYWTDPTKLQKQVDFLEGHQDYVLCHHDAVIVDECGNLIAPSKLPENLKRDFSEDELIKGAWILTLTACFRNVLRDFPPEYFRVFNGDTFLFSLLGNFGRSKYLGDKISPDVYRRHSGGIWSTLKKHEKNYHSLITYYWLGEYYKRLGKAHYSEHFLGLYRRGLLMLLGNSQRIRSAKYVLMAWREFVSRPENLLNRKFSFNFVSYFAETTARNIYHQLVKRKD